MTHSILKSLICAGLLAAASSAAHAATPGGLEIGKPLTAAQKSATPLKTVVVGTQKYRVLAASAGAEPVSTLADSRDIVGRSRNEVVVSELPTAQVQAAVNSLALDAVSTKYYAHMNLSVLRFRSFAAAAGAKDQLAKALPDTAKLSVPVQFSEVKPR